MTEVSFFQIYSQKENHATNNTLLLLSHLYQRDVAKLEHVLSELLEYQVEVGPRFLLQVKGSSSVPDAQICQRPFQIHVETKLGNEINTKQIKAHLESMANDKAAGEQCFLLIVTRDPLSEERVEELNSLGKSKGFPLAVTTFSAIGRSAMATCGRHEDGLIRIVEDYELFLEREQIGELGDELHVVPVGTSYEENLRFGMYFESASRPSKKDRRFLGLYRNKTVGHVGEISSVAVRCADGSVKIEKPPEIPAEDIQKMIKDCAYYPNLEREDLRFYRVSSFHETSFRKVSAGGLWGSRVFRVNDYLDPKNDAVKDADELARVLKNREFK